MGIERGPLISVVMPAYNPGAYLLGAVLSVLNQQYRCLELVVVDDASSDDLARHLKIFDDQRIRYIRQESNGGIARALNRGFREARGRFVARMDADDIMEPWRLGEQLQYMLDNRLTLLGSGAEKFGEEQGLIHPASSGREIVDSFLVGNPFVHPTVVFDRERLGDHFEYDEDFRCEEDYELWSRLVDRNNCGNITYSTLKYRVSVSSNANHPQKKRLNRLVLSRFSRRFGLDGIAPLDELSEVQMAGYVSAPAFEKLADYAHRAQSSDLPKLGWLHRPLLKYSSYRAFFRWFNDAKRFSNFRAF